MVYTMGIRNVIVVGLGNNEASFTPLPLTFCTFARVGTFTTEFNLKHKIMDLLKILFEKRHPNSCKCAVSGWVSYDWNKPETRPTKYGKYFVHRKDGKIHWETWNGSGWAYNGNVITFWMEVLPPCH